jgi:hypothetical protein
MKIPREVRELESLIKVNKHLGIALAELTNTHSYIGSLREQKKLISVKLKLEAIMERTLQAEKSSKDSFFRRLK